MSSPTLHGYEYGDATTAHTHAYLFPVVLRELGKLPSGSRVFDLGCGNGSTAAELASRGFEVVGVDPSAEGIAIAQQAHPECRLESGSTEDDLAARFGAFKAVVSLEVVEHVYSPRRYAEVIAGLLEPGGIAIISTPYHSYLKNLALAVTGKMEQHFTALWEGGHIKFWSRKTLDELFANAGFRPIAFDRVGRLPALANSMVCTYRKGVA